MQVIDYNLMNIFSEYDGIKCKWYSPVKIVQ